MLRSERLRRRPTGDGVGTTSAAAGPWSYEDATGKTVEMDSTPKRVVVLNDLAISFIEYGLRPVGTFGQLTMAKDARFEGLDTDGITQLGEAYGDIDLEELAALKPDLVVTSVYPKDEQGTLDDTQPGYGFKDKEQERQIQAIAPVVQVEWGGKGEDVIEEIADLAESLGAPESKVEAAEQRFDEAEDTLEQAAKRSDVSVVSMYADGSGAYVTRPADEPTLQMYSSFGVDFVQPKPKGFYWGIYSWENAGQITATSSCSRSRATRSRTSRSSRRSPTTRRSRRVRSTAGPSRRSTTRRRPTT